MIDAFDYSCIPLIAGLCFGFVELLKKTLGHERQAKNAYPLIAMILGGGIGAIGFAIDPSLMGTNSVWASILAGMTSGLSATGGYEVVRRMRNPKGQALEVIDSRPPKYYITGDKHRDFDSLIEFCQKNELRRQDVIVILGDSGFNYYGDERDDALKTKIRDLKVTLFCIHGNKENRPENIPTYGYQTFHGGLVYYEPCYPNIFFAIDGEVYNFNGKEFMVIGGAHSVDKMRCLSEGLPFWNDEMPDSETKDLVENRLEMRNHRIDGFLTHTCPMSCLPTEVFISTKRMIATKGSTRKRSKKTSPQYPLDIDRSTEEWLEEIKRETEYDIWYCGHYHIDKTLGKIRMLYREILPFCDTCEERG